jgi:stress-induced morphogen
VPSPGHKKRHLLLCILVSHSTWNIKNQCRFFCPGRASSQKRTHPLAPLLLDFEAHPSTFPRTASSNSETSPCEVTMAETQGVSEADLKSKIIDQLQAIHVDIEDMSSSSNFTPPSRSNLALTDRFAGGCGQAFSAVIVSPQFEKKTTLARHRLVNTALKAEIAAIHAWTPKCYTPEQWEKQKAEGKEAVAPGEDTTGYVVTGTTA